MTKRSFTTLGALTLVLASFTSAQPAMAAADAHATLAPVGLSRAVAVAVAVAVAPDFCAMTGSCNPDA